MKVLLNDVLWLDAAQRLMSFSQSNLVVTEKSVRLVLGRMQTIESLILWLNGLVPIVCTQSQKHFMIVNCDS